jgi:TetR/AcrR family transcriptional repressor of mexJK operon
MESMKRPSEKQKAILSAAKTLFLTKGFQCTSMDEITVLAGVSKKTVYHHFADKVALFQTVIKAHWDEILQTGNNNSLQRSLEPREALYHFCRDFMVFSYHPDTMNLLRLIIAENPSFPNLGDLFLVGGTAPFTQKLVHYLCEKSKDGTFNIIDPKRAASQLIGLLKEDQFWPKMLGFITIIDHSKTEVLIDEALSMFFAHYQSH